MSTPDFSYYNAIDQIYHAEWSIPKLARLELLRKSIRTMWPNGHPTKMIHVAGTGGKGSTCRFLELGLTTLGNAGAYFSPHLFEYRERFSINGEFASREDIIWAWEERVKPHILRLLLENPHHQHTFLESSILIALALYEKYEVAWAAIETHVGGRYDPTRGLDAAVTLLTNVGSDHAAMLGHELWQRALDKAGIARPGIPFFTSETKPEALTVVTDVCSHVGAPMHVVDAAQVAAFAERVVALCNEQIPDESLLSATYQKWNATLAMTALQQTFPNLDEAKVLKSFLNARLLGRFWKVEERVYADVAHNVEKLAALAGEIEVKFGRVGKILVLGASRQRVPIEIFPPLAKVAKAIVITGSSYKGQDPRKVREEIAPLIQNTPTLVIADPREALQTAKSMQAGDDIIILTGSTYMIEQVLNPDPYMRYINSTFGWRMESKSEATGVVQLMLPPSPSPMR
ncbi:MAG: hypothetical protein R2911_20165 [Caldilineaceae bacterium]